MPHLYFYIAHNTNIKICALSKEIFLTRHCRSVNPVASTSGRHKVRALAAPLIKDPAFVCGLGKTHCGVNVHIRAIKTALILFRVADVHKG